MINFKTFFDIIGSATFSAFSWSPDNTKLLYVAEKKLPKSEPFYKQKSKSKNDKPVEEEPSRVKKPFYIELIEEFVYPNDFP